MSTILFDQLNLIPPICRALVEEGYTAATPVQAAAIPPALQGRDLLGCAQTGTGKTAAFALPILNVIGKSQRAAVPNAPFALVLAPTRELAAQIGESFAAYGRHVQTRQTVIFGGTSQAQQVRNLNRGSQIVIATPGRLLDLMNQGHIQLDQLKVFVLDEADRMLDMGFLPDLKRIIARLPKQRQSLFFSATLAPQIVELAGRLLRDPVQVNVTPKTRTVERIDQRVVFVEKPRKRELLSKVLRGKDVDRAVVFTRTKRGADAIAKHLSHGGIDAAAIHGNKSQNARQRTLTQFRDGRLRVLVATDLAARGIDVEGVTHVVNFEMPTEPESYVHRIGRTGRAGANGNALTFCDSTERGGLRAIERLIGKALPVEGELPQSRTPAHGTSKRRSAGESTVTQLPSKSDSNSRGSHSGAKAKTRTGRRPRRVSKSFVRANT